jgi:hypothetical protein
MNISELYLLETLKSFKGLKSNAEKAIEQINDNQMHFHPDEESNSVAVIMHHMAGNMLSRFTDFLTTDGEKEWRDRDSEFIDDNSDKKKIFSLWNKGWDCLLSTLQSLKPEDLDKTVYIRGEEHTVIRALQRQLAHYAYHTGQIVFLCKQIRKSEFKSLTIPRGQSKSFVPEGRK